MMWSILVAWALVDGFQDMWLVQSPVFPSQEACMAYGRVYQEKIIEDAMREFMTDELPEKLYCIDQAAIDFLNKKGFQVEQL